MQVCNDLRCSYQKDIEFGFYDYGVVEWAIDGSVTVIGYYVQEEFIYVDESDEEVDLGYVFYV